MTISAMSTADAVVRAVLASGNDRANVIELPSRSARLVRRLGFRNRNQVIAYAYRIGVM